MKTTKSLIRIMFLLSFLTVSFLSCKREVCNGNDCNEHLVSACSEDVSMSKPIIRIVNVSKYNFCNVVLDPYFTPTNCGMVKAGASTCYRSFEIAYPFAYIQFFINGKEFKMAPRDYVDAIPVVPGNYSYFIDIIDFNTGKFSYTFQKD
ncbi:MAG: hypothetical protein IPK62_10645 [Bacteroidetes bacterium]|nr:hypothetical protein [Bacteroidota bacterium]